MLCSYCLAYASDFTESLKLLQDIEFLMLAFGQVAPLHERQFKSPIQVWI